MRAATIFLIALLAMPMAALATTWHTITVDGDTSDFDDDELIWEDSENDCAWEFNELYRMYVTWDADNLYLGADFLIEEANSVDFYMDFASMSPGATDLGTIGWYKSFYAEGWSADFSVNASGNGTHGIYRIYDDFSHDEWTSNSSIQKNISLPNMMYECAIPWDVLYQPDGFPVNASMGIVCTLVGYREYDGADAMPQQTVEPNGDGEYDTLDVIYYLDFDADGDGVPDEGWHPDTNSGAEGQPPFASARAVPTSGPAPLTVQFEGMGSDPDGGSVDYHWDFGDGGASDQQHPEHTYDNAGDYTAVLTVTDDEDMSRTDSVDIHVTGGGTGELILALNLSKIAPDCFGEGDLFRLQANVENTGTSNRTVDFYCALEVVGMYFFYPTWTEALAKETITVPAGGDWNKDLLGPFPWPANTGSLSGLYFYSLATEPGGFDVATNIEIIEFCYQ